jgi:RHS repeat-associated protein
MFRRCNRFLLAPRWARLSLSMAPHLLPLRVRVQGAASRAPEVPLSAVKRTSWTHRCLIAAVGALGLLAGTAVPARAGYAERVTVAPGPLQLSKGGQAVAADNKGGALFFSGSPEVSPTGQNDLFYLNRIRTVLETYTGDGVDGFRDITMTPDGRFVLASTYRSLVPSDTDQNSDVYLIDRSTHAYSLISSGVAPGSSNAAVAISPNGRYILYFSDAPYGLYVRDRELGTTTATNYEGIRILDDGRVLVWTAQALQESDTNGQRDFYLGAQAGPPYFLVSVASDGAAAGVEGDVAVAANGRYIAYRSTSATVVAGDNNGAADVFLRDLATGGTVLVSRGLGGQAAGARSVSSVSAHGRYVLFASASQEIVADDANAVNELFVRDILTGGTARASMNSQGGELDGEYPVAVGAMSPSGRYVVFTTNRWGVVPEDTNDLNDGFIIDRGPQVSDILVSLPVEQTFGRPSQDLDANQCIPARSGMHGDPVNTATGAMLESATDLALPSAGIPVTFTRDYTSLDQTSGPLGPSWTHPYLASITLDDDGDAIVRSETGQQVTYSAMPDGSFVTPPGARATLVRTSQGYTVAARDNRVTTFDLQGRLVGKTLHGLGVVFDYDGSGHLATITDSAGRIVNLTYNVAGDRLTKVQLPDGRYVGYTYNAGGRLETVRDARGGTTTYAYDSAGRLVSERDQNGHFRFRNTYDPPTGRVVSQTDARDQTITFTWDGPTQTATTTYPNGGVWKETYSGNVPISRTDPLGRTTTWTYDEALNCVATTDPMGRVTTREFDARGNLTKTMSPGPTFAVEERTYDANNNLTSITDPRNKTTRFDYDTLGRRTVTTNPDGKTQVVVYNTFSLPATVTDERGKLTSYGYDATGNRTSVTTPLGKVTTFGFDTAGRVMWRTDPRGNASGGNPLAYRTSFTYNDSNQVLAVTDPVGHVTTYGYDPVGNRTSVLNARSKLTLIVYDEMNRETSITDPAGGIGSISYDNVGNVASRTSATGGVTTFAYDKVHQLTDITMPRGNVSGATAETYTWHFGYDLAGNQTTVTDPADKVTTTAFDELNRPTSVTDPLMHLTQTEYDAAGNVVSRIDGFGNKTTFGYDGLGRLETVTSPRGNIAGATQADYQTRFVYDEVGNRTDVNAPKGGRTHWTFDDDSRLASMVDPRGYVAPNTPAPFTTTYSYDDAGNLIQEKDPLNSITGYSVDAANRRTAVIDANGKQTLFTYDEIDAIKSVSGPDAPACTGTPQCVAGKAATVYVYDDAGRLWQKIDPKNHITSFEYDSDGRVKKKADALNRFWTYTYDSDGNPATTTPARGTGLANPATMRITYTHDNVGRLTKTDYADSTPDVTFTYDFVGRRASMVDGGGTVNYTYDNADRMTAINRVGGDTWSYQYDPDSNVTRRTYPDSTQVNATYDRDGNLWTVAQGTNTTTFAYDEAGRLKTTTLPSGNGHVETRAYDPAGRLTQVKNAKGATTLSQFTRTLDPVGNPTLVATLRGTTTTNEAMQYDVSNRLTKWCQAVTCTGATKWISYAYDAVGNRTQQVRTGVATPGTTNYTYDAADQMTSSVVGTTTTTSTYDEDGNQKTQGTTAFTYDLAGRMTSNKIGTATATNYTYDGDGNRRTRATGTTINTKYSWDTQNPLPELALERNNSNALIRRYVQGAAGPISMATSATATFYYHRDHLGSITDVTSSTGAAQWRYDYEPYGAQLTATKVVTSAPANPARYTGEYLDTELTDYNLRARQYDPTTGRFRATDPVTPARIDQYVSAYAYANNQPGVYTDPSGLVPSLGDIAGGIDDGVRAVAGGGARIVGSGVKELVGGTYQMVRHPIATGQAFWEGCKRGRTFEVVTSCIDGNTIQPTWDALEDIRDAIQCSDWARAQELAGALAGSLVGRKGVHTPGGGGAAKVVETERIGQSVKASEATIAWDEFLGAGEHTNIHPRLGTPDPNRIVSADGTRSVRFGPHEMNSSPNKLHYHEETWAHDPATSTWSVENVLRRVRP